MIEVWPFGGVSETRVVGKSFGLKFGLVAIFLVVMGGIGWGAPKKPGKPVAKTSTAKKKSGAKAGSAVSRLKGKKAASVSKTKKGAGKASKYKGHAVVAVPFHPQYYVAKPVPQAPVAAIPAPVVPTRDAGQDARQEVKQEAKQEAGQEVGEQVPTPVLPVPTDEPLPAETLLPELPGPAFRYPHALDGFFKALAARQGVSTGGPIVRIMQYGDSHTAADIFTGEMRRELQAGFGNGGLGYQYPGHPFAGYRLLGSSRSQTNGWVTQGNRFTQLGDGDTGLGGIAISTSRPGESVFLTTTCETLQVQYLKQPGGGAVDFSVDGQPVSEIKTAVDDPMGTREAATFTYSCTPGVHEFQLITMDVAPVRLLGLVTEQAGVTYECLGINGAVAPLILRWNQSMFESYLGQRNPNLIVLAYGTNEATGDGSRNAEYVAQFHTLLQTLHSVVPGASILVLGPYDRALRTGRGRRASWRTATAIDRIIADYREACRVDNCAFYDQRARMGGPGAMMHWAATGLAQATIRI